MKRFINKIINSVLGKFGYKISRKENGFSLNNKLDWLKKYNIKTIYDIGANEGQFAEFIVSIYPESNIYSFEPIVSCFEKLKSVGKRYQKICPLNYALGDEEAEMEINVNEFTPSSSILKMVDSHIENFPFTKNTKKEVIKVNTLDNVYLNFDNQENVLVKIDVQGYEGKVLKGGINFFSRIPKIVIVETSIVKLYESEPSFNEIYRYFIDLNYSFKGVMNQLYSPATGEILQADIIFVK